MRQCMTAEPREVIAAARSGSLDALGELYRRHADAVHALAYRMLGSVDDAADVLQDVFVGLPHALRSYSEQGRFESWLKQVTVRACLMRQRGKRRKRELRLDDVPLDARAAATSHPLDRLAVQRAVEALPDPLRAVFALREIEGYSHAEIGALLGISAANSATRLARAWSQLRKELQS
jgi:RNA polymerase sigma-70 factor (ECF subfamily)